MDLTLARHFRKLNTSGNLADQGNMYVLDAPLVRFTLARYG